MHVLPAAEGIHLHHLCDILRLRGVRSSLPKAIRMPWPSLWRENGFHNNYGTALSECQEAD